MAARVRDAIGRADEPDDAALVRAALAERAAFGALYDRYLPAVYAFCARRLGARETAEDVTSLVFTRALAGLSGCDPARFRSWLFAIAHHAVADSHRAPRDPDPLDDADADALPDPEPTPLEHALLREDERRVLALLAHLTPSQRDVVELRLAGLSGPEIAAALGLSPGAVRATQFRAYARLRELTGPHGDGGALP